MSTKDCLKDENLVLHYYGELTDSNSLEHLSGCIACKERLAALSCDLDRLPTNECEPDDLVGTRMAARVTEKLRQPKRRLWLPAAGATAAAALVLVLTLTSAPPPEIKQVVQTQTTPAASFDLGEDIPDIEFLEDLELLQDLELLAQIEGV